MFSNSGERIDVLRMIMAKHLLRERISPIYLAQIVEPSGLVTTNQLLQAYRLQAVSPGRHQADSGEPTRRIRINDFINVVFPHWTWLVSRRKGGGKVWEESIPVPTVTSTSGPTQAPIVGTTAPIVATVTPTKAPIAGTVAPVVATAAPVAATMAPVAAPYLGTALPAVATNAPSVSPPNAPIPGSPTAVTVRNLGAFGFVGINTCSNSSTDFRTSIHFRQRAACCCYECS
jgi:hypothetical protein